MWIFLEAVSELAAHRRNYESRLLHMNYTLQNTIFWLFTYIYFCKTNNIFFTISVTEAGSCYNCGKSGHMSRDCTEERATTDTRSCYNCNQTGHLSRDCPSSTGGGRREDSRKCYKCGEEGHMSRECTNTSAQSAQSSSRGGGECYTYVYSSYLH